jgi:hypothetical protein
MEELKRMIQQAESPFTIQVSRDAEEEGRGGQEASVREADGAGGGASSSRDDEWHRRSVELETASRARPIGLGDLHFGLSGGTPPTAARAIGRAIKIHEV